MNDLNARSERVAKANADDAESFRPYRHWLLERKNCLRDKFDDLDLAIAYAQRPRLDMSRTDSDLAFRYVMCSMEGDDLGSQRS
jgi:hypothetical protein